MVGEWARRCVTLPRAEPRPRRGPPESDFYRRKRRLAWTFALLSFVLLWLHLGVGFFFEHYDLPQIDAADDGVLVAWVSKSTDDDGAGTRVLRLDASLRPLEPPVRVLGEAGGALLRGDELTLFFGTRYQVLRAGNSIRGAELGQTWDVRAAVRAPRRDVDWIFGWHDGRLVARRRELGTFSETIDVAPSGVPGRVVAAMDGSDGPLVAWRETASDVVRAAVYDGRTFVARAPARLPDADEWSAALAGGRVLHVTYDRDDRAFRTVGLRVRCCADCPSPLPEARADFADSVLLLGKAVEGLAVTRSGDRLVAAVARTSTMQAAAFGLPGLEPATARLVPVAAEPRWRHVLGFLSPVAMLFFSFSIIFLGYTLLRERSAFVLEKLTPVADEGPTPAAILERAMARILDLMLLLLPYAFAAEILNLSPEAIDPADGRFWALVGFGYGLSAAYHAVFESLLGWTPGKRILGLRVTKLDGSRVGFRGALVRNLLRPLDAEFPFTVFVGMGVMMATRRRQRLGDVAARTMVVRDPRGA